MAIASRGAQWVAETEDVGPGGCQLVSPRVIAAGGEVRLAIATDAFAEKLSVLGRVAWNSPTPPIRLGVAFAQKLASADPRRWFEHLLQADPALAASLHRLPDQLPVSALLYLGQPPRFIIDFTADELVVLRVLQNGSRIDDILAAVGIDPNASARAIFSLLARRAIVLSRTESVAAQRWAEVFARADGGRFIEPPRVAAPSSLPLPRETAAPTAAQNVQPSTPIFDGSSRSRIDARAEAASRRAASPPPPASLEAREGLRRPEAQALLDDARRDLAAGGLSEAIALLRRALALSPRDAEISALLGELAFRNRRV